MLSFLLLAFLPLVASKVLLRYNPAAGDPASVLGLQNLQGWDGAEWPSGQPQNASAYFKTEKDPSGVPAGHVHRDPHFLRSEYHALNGKTLPDQTYYIGYHAMWKWDDPNVNGMALFQWKEFLEVNKSNIPLVLAISNPTKNPDSPIIAFNAQTVANTRNDRSQVWSKTIQLDTPYRFGIIINTSRTAGFVQLYFNGQPATMSDPASGAHTTKLAGNFFPGRADPKFGLYAGTTASATDAYIYDVVIGDGLDDIREVAGL